MSDRTRAIFISLSILALVLFSAFGTIPVYADDGTTTGTTETTTTTGTDPVATEQPASDPSTATDTQQPPADGTTPTTEAQPVVETTTPLLEQVPENITVTVVSETGEAQPLVSQDSADAVLLSDPIWCPAGQAPTPGANGCTQSYSSFTELLDFLKANEGDAAYQQDGTIYVQQGAYAGGEQTIDLNSYNFTEINKKNLTVTGGWDTNTNVVNSTSTFNVPIIIGSSSNPWIGSLTLNNIIINGATDQTGLTLYSQGNVELSNVEVTNSQNGAEVNAGGNVTIKNSKLHNNKEKGADVTAGGAVDVSNSDFSNNGSGLGINSKGAVTLMDVAANNNQLFGANIVSMNSVLVSNSQFNGNQSYYWFGNKTYFGTGLQVTTIADIAVLNVTADNNYVLGAHLESSDTAIRDSSFSNNGTGTGLDVVGKGLEIVGTTDPNFGNGNVALRNVVANNNEVFGANIQTPGNVAINADTGKTSSFSGQLTTTYDYDTGTGIVGNVGGGYGLQIVAGGNIALRNVIATGNYLFGASLSGNNVDITNGDFSSNGSGLNYSPSGYGLNIKGKGNVTLNTITANTNQLYGADILAVGNISIATGFFSGHQTVTVDPCLGITFYGYGLTAVSQQGDVILDAVQANFNNLWGAKLEGNSVTVANSQFNNNVSDSSQFIDDTGLLITSHGADSFVFIDNSEAKENRLIGATIVADGGVYIWNSTFTGNAGVTCSISWCPSGSEIYWGYGLNVVTPGIISLQNVNASGNNLFGANLQGGTVEVSGGTFNNNQFGDGLTISSGGTVTLTNVTASGNGEDGVDVTTPACAVVQVSDGTFTNNTQYGLNVTGGVLTTTGTQTFGGNGAGNVFQNPATCAIVLSMSTASAPRTTTVNTNTSSSTTTVSAGTSTTKTTVTTAKKTTKVKKAVVKKHKVQKAAKVRHARKSR